MPAMTTHDRKFMIFSLQGSLYALDLKQVAEVGDPPQMWPIPLAPPCYSGALDFHGDIVAVMNLALFLGLPGGRQPGKIIVLHREISSLAFLVDTIVRIVSEEEVSFSKPSENGLTAAMLCLNDGEATQLDLETLVHEAEIEMQRKSLVS
jgi:purine-binding chemotaxis protein CheW